VFFISSSLTSISKLLANPNAALVGNTLEDSKWWVIDWKSNLISGIDNSDCLPRNYNYENMRNEMIKHHYPLQSHLYLLA